MTWEEYKAMKSRDANATIEQNEVRTSKNSIEGMSWQEYKQKREEQRRLEEERRKREEEQRRIEAKKQEEKRQKIVNQQASKKADNIINNINSGKDLTELQKAYSNLSMEEQAALAKKAQETANSTAGRLGLVGNNQNIIPLTNIDTNNLTEVSAEDIKQQEKASKRAKEINKAVNDKDYLSAAGYALEGLGEGFKSGIAGLGQAGLNIGAYALERSAKRSPYKWEKEMLENWKNSLIDNAKYLQDNTSYYQKATSGIDNNLVRTSGQVTNVVGEMIPSMLANFAAPGSGAIISGVQAGGHSATENINADRSNLGKSVLTGTAKGIAAGAVEKIVGGDFISEGMTDKLAAKGISKATGNKFAQNLLWKTYQVGGEVVEENLEDSIDDVIDAILNEKDLPSLEEKLNQIGETSKVTGLSTLVLSTLGLGGGNIDTTLSETLPTATQMQELPKATEVAPRAGQAIENKEIAPAATQENTYSNKLKQSAIEEINKSNISNQDKTEMLNVLNGLDTVTDADITAIRNTIQEIKRSQELDTKGDYKNDQERRQKYMQYKNDTSTYDSTAVDEVLETISQNRNGRRTVKQWLQAADEIGKRIANLSNEEIEKIAYKSWFDIQPSKSITQYDRQAKKPVGFQKFTSDEWINTINKAVNEARNNNQVQETVQQEAQELPVVDQKNAISTEVPKSLVESAKQQGFKYKDMNLEQVQKALDNKGIKSRFDAAEFSNENEGAKWKLTRNEDGTVTREIILNPNANEKTVVQEMAIHELTHDIVAKNTDTTAKLYDEVKSWLEKDTDYQEQLKSLEEIYGKELAEEEAIAKTLQTKFGTQEEINNLVNYNRSMARKLYDWVVDKLNKITGGKIEKLYWEDVRNKFERAYNEEGNYSKSSERFDIREDEKLGRYWNVEDSKDIFKGLTKTKDLQNEAYKYILNGNDNFEYITDKIDNKQVRFARISAQEYVYGRNAKDLNKEQYNQKMRTAPSIDDLINNADITYHSPLTHKSSLFKDGFNNYQGKVGIDNNIFQYIVRVGKAQNDNLFYDLSLEYLGDKNGTEIKVPGVKNTSLIKNSVPNNSITSSKQNVNTTDYNMQKSQNNTQDNQGRTLSKQQQEYFKNSKATNENGQLEVVYHGTNKAGFTEFNRNWNYYTNNKEVAQSYTGGIEMVDTRRLESVSDAKSWLKGITDELYIEGNSVYDYDGEKILSYDNPDTMLKNLKRDIQKEIGDTNAGGTYQGYVNIEKPISIDAHNEIWSKIAIDNIEIEGIDNIEEFLKKYGSSVWKESGKLRTSTNDIVAAISDAIDNGDLDVDGVIIKNIYDEGGYGNTTPTEAGTDYITFKSNQFKALDNFSPTTNPDIRYSISDDTSKYEQLKNKNLSNVLDSDKVIKLAKKLGTSASFLDANISGDSIYSAVRFIARNYPNLIDEYISKNNLKYETVYEDLDYSGYGQELLDFIKNNKINVEKLALNKDLRNKYFNLKEEVYSKYGLSEEKTQELKERYNDAYDMQEDYLKKGNKDIMSILKKFNREFEAINNGDTKRIVDYATKENKLKVAEENGFNDYIAKMLEPLLNKESLKLSSEELTQLAQDTFGTTDNFNVGAYMTPDGKLLNFGENGYRNDHRDISSIGYSMNEFIDAGNIRMKPEGNGFELAQEPTQEQYNTLKEYIDSLDGEIFIEIDTDKNKYDGANYKKGTPTNKIISDLQYYFKNGKFPAKSEFADFMYSKQQKGFDQYLENRIGKKGTRTTLGELRSTYNTAPTADNVLATSEYTKKQALNPTEIANTNKESMNTTPQLETKNYKRGNKQSSFVSNILNDAQFLNKDLRQEMSKDENIRYYSGITNAETLEKAYNSLTEGGEKETLNWFSKDEKNTTAEDVAKGWILLKQYQDSGDYQGAVEVAKKMRQMGTSAGQAVQAYNIMARMSPEGMFYYAQSELNEAYNKMVEGKSKQWIEKNQDKFTLTPEETQTIIDTMKEVSEMEDGREKSVKLAQIQQLVSDKIPPTAGQGIKAWMRISMLFNPKTQVRNVMGNTVVLPVNATADVFSGAIDKLISKKTGVRTTGVTTEGIKGYAKGFKKGLFESYDDFRKGINTRNVEGNRFEIGEGKSFTDKGLGKALNRIDNILSFSLDVGDRGFYEASFTNSINNQLVLNKTNQVTQEMIDIATNEALQRTWQDNNSYTEVVLSIRRNLNKLNVKGYGLGDVLIPFAKTPANLTKAIVDYSPVGLTKTLTLDAKKFNNSLHNGQYSAQLQHQFVQNLGKGMAGSLLYALGYGLAKAGFATGESDDDKDVKNFMKNSLGIGSYSIKIGNKSFTYDWAQPVATPLAIMTNYVKYSKDNPDAKAVEKAIKSLDIGSEQLLKQSFMESINTVLNGSGTTMENLTQAVLDLPARAVPTFSKQIADMVDSTQRTSFEYGQPVQSAINSAIAKIPFASRTLPASIDTLGNEIQKYGGNNNAWNVMINPANTNKGQLSKAGEEIYNVYMETGDTTIFPRTAPYYINSKGEKITMTAQERSKFQTTTGKYVEDSLSALIKDSDYKKLSNEEKAKIINEIVSDSYSKAKYDVLKIDSKEYEKLRTTLQDIKPSTYYDYKFKTEGMKKDNEKISVLIDSNYTNAEKTKIYETYIGTNDDKYNIMKNTNININEYLKYKTQDFSADKEDDGTINGKSISGSAKNKRWNYINNMNVTYMQKLMLYGMEYTVSDNEQAQIANYINSLSIPKDEKLEMLSHFKGFTIYKDGSFKY